MSKKYAVTFASFVCVIGGFKEAARAAARERGERETAVYTPEIIVWRMARKKRC
jgi:hypothetical protein